MATVRFSRELQSEITENAKKLFTKRIDAAANNIDPTWGWRIYHAALGEFKAQALALPSGYCKVDDDLGVAKVEYYLGNSSFHGPSNRLKFHDPESEDPEENVFLPLPVDKFEPTRLGLRDYNTYSGFHDLIIIASDPRWGTIPDELYAYRQELDASRESLSAFLKGVDKVMATFTTLAPALKAWPPLWDLLSESTKDKHREIGTRLKKEAPTLKHDMEALTAAVTVAKLTK